MAKCQVNLLEVFQNLIPLSPYHFGHTYPMATLDARMMRSVALGAKLCQLRLNCTPLIREKAKRLQGRQPPRGMVDKGAESHIPPLVLLPNGSFHSLCLTPITRLEQVRGTH